jgi:hypothetical protein
MPHVWSVPLGQFYQKNNLAITNQSIMSIPQEMLVEKHLCIGLVI